MVQDELINVQVSYALPDEQMVMDLKVAVDTTVEQAIEESGLLHQYPEIELGKNKVGIYGKLVKLAQVLREGDRIEIYRPLTADPKEVRKLRAAEGKTTRRGAADINQKDAAKT